MTKFIETTEESCPKPMKPLNDNHAKAHETKISLALDLQKICKVQDTVDSRYLEVEGTL